MTAANWLKVWFLGLAAALLVFIAAMSVGWAHDHNRPELNSWFTGLHSGKGYCCDGSDALSIEDADWDSKDGHYRVRIDVSRETDKTDMEWVDVPDDAVITEPNKYGRALVWPIYGYVGVSIRCFLPGAEG